MPRIARIAPKGHVYHVLTRGNNRQYVFNEYHDYERYLDLLWRYKREHDFRLYHYVLMGNHVHLVLEMTEQGGSLADIMKGLNLSYAQYYKSRYSHVGHFWQDRYKSIIISKDKYLLACGSYVELNPVRAKIVEDPKEYRWSSYNVYAYGQKNPVVEEHPIYLQLSENEAERRKKYREFVTGMITDKDAMKGEMRMRTVYGDEDFIVKMREQFNIDPVIRPKGRPKKEKMDDK
jgi:putative transposase